MGFIFIQPALKQDGNMAAFPDTVLPEIGRLLAALGYDSLNPEQIAELDTLDSDKIVDKLKEWTKDWELVFVVVFAHGASSFKLKEAFAALSGYGRTPSFSKVLSYSQLQRYAQYQREPSFRSFLLYS